MRYIISQMKVRETSAVAKESKISQRHVQRLWAEYLKTGKAHIQGRAGRPKKPPPSDAKVDWCWTPTAAVQTGRS